MNGTALIPILPILIVLLIGQLAMNMALTFESDGKGEKPMKFMGKRRLLCFARNAAEKRNAPKEDKYTNITYGKRRHVEWLDYWVTGRQYHVRACHNKGGILITILEQTIENEDWKETGVLMLDYSKEFRPVQTWNTRRYSEYAVRFGGDTNE